MVKGQQGSLEELIRDRERTSERFYKHEGTRPSTKRHENKSLRNADETDDISFQAILKKRRAKIIRRVYKNERVTKGEEKEYTNADDNKHILPKK